MLLLTDERKKKGGREGERGSSFNQTKNKHQIR